MLSGNSSQRVSLVAAPRTKPTRGFAPRGGGHRNGIECDGLRFGSGLGVSVGKENRMRKVVLLAVLAATLCPTSALAQPVWGTWVLLTRYWEDTREVRHHWGMAWNHASGEEALKEAMGKCAEDAGAEGRHCKALHNTRAVRTTVVAFSASTSFGDDRGLVSQRNPRIATFSPGMDDSLRGKAFILKYRCALIWTQRRSRYITHPNTPVAVFADSDADARKFFADVVSQSANVGRGWEDELESFCNHR